MGRDDVKKALEAMAADDALVDKIAGGDLDDLSVDELTDAERSMLVAAADDWPEVSGFAFNFDGKVEDYLKIPTRDVKYLDASSPLGSAFKYAGFENIKIKY